MTHQGTPGPRRRFPSPFDVPAIGGAASRTMYPRYLLLSEDDRGWEENAFWYLDSMHFPDVMYPFDSVMVECMRLGMGQYNGRIFAVPLVNGLEPRLINGRVYITPILADDAADSEERSAAFIERAGHYYEHWSDIYASWRSKMEHLIHDLAALPVPRLEELEDIAVVHDARGYSAGYSLLKAYNTAIDNLFLAWQYHFELLNLGYIAYFNLFQFCKQAFPRIKDETIAQMVAGVDMLLFRPDDELKRLARLAIDLQVGTLIRSSQRPEDIIEQLRMDERGLEWVHAWEGTHDPWFNLSKGTGFTHTDGSWADDIRTPWTALVNYIDRIERGESIERPIQALLAERTRLIEGYGALLQDPDDQADFQRNIELALMVAPYVEDHSFYVEHWHHTTFWKKIREFADRLAEGGYLADREDMFYLHRWEVGQALHDLVGTWSSGARATGAAFWQREVATRKQSMEHLHSWNALPAMGMTPTTIDEPITAMLFGITSNQIERWTTEDSEPNILRGIPASPGVVTGIAHVVLSANQLLSIKQDEILVCASIPPSWAPVFSKISGAVCESGGMMSHAAIICREYGLPVVSGTANATRVIQHGARITVDGLAGTVTILE